MAFGKVITRQPTAVKKRALSAKISQQKHEKSEEELKNEFFASSNYSVLIFNTNNITYFI
jgi:hypothetical protein